MKILIVSQYFWPETFRINDLAAEFVLEGHEVTVITGNPNYPHGRFYQGYGFNYSIETHEGIKIHRVPIIPRGKNNLSLILNYISFALSGSIFTLFHKSSYDKIIAVNFSPITAVYPAIVYKKRKKTKILLWVQDLWPESVRAASNLKSGFIDKLLLAIVRNIYKNCDRIIVSNDGFKESIEEKGVKKEKIDYIPNWAEDLYEDKSKIDVEKFRSLMPDGFIVMFAGNIGEAQDFNSIIEATELTRNYQSIKWIVIGDGRKRVWLEDEILKRKLGSTVYILGRFPVEDMPSLFIHADVLLASLRNEYIFSLTVPAKIQSYMAFGKPILTMLSGAGNKIINEAKCGLIAESSDFKKLAENVIRVSSFNKIELSQLGENGKNYYDENFAKRLAISKFNKLLSQQ
jgi:glycosyltransferase involved in cell wall biosynthesis